MNRQNTAKLGLFLNGLETRLDENAEFFRKISVSFKSGTRVFNAEIHLKDGRLSMNFNGVTETLEVSWLSARLSRLSESYEAVTVSYEERGTTLVI